MVSQQEMPYPPYFSNNLTLILGFFMPFFLVLSFSFIVPPLLKRIVYEKETGVKVLLISGQNSGNANKSFRS